MPPLKYRRKPRPTVTLPVVIEEEIDKMVMDTGQTKNGVIVTLLAQALGLDIPAPRAGRPWWKKQDVVIDDDAPFQF